MKWYHGHIHTQTQCCMGERSVVEQPLLLTMRCAMDMLLMNTRTDFMQFFPFRNFSSNRRLTPSPAPTRNSHPVSLPSTAACVCARIYFPMIVLRTSSHTHITSQIFVVFVRCALHAMPSDTNFSLSSFFAATSCNWDCDISTYTEPPQPQHIAHRTSEWLDGFFFILSMMMAMAL